MGIIKHFRLWHQALSMVWKIVPKLTVLWAFLLILQGLLPITVIYLTKLTIDSFVGADKTVADISNFYRAGLFLLLTGLAMFLAELIRPVFDLVRTQQSEYFSDYMKNLTQIKAAEVDLEFFESPMYHDVMERARGESQVKPLTLLENFGTLTQNAITLLSFGAILFTYGWAIPLLLLIGTIPGMYVSLKFDKVYHKWWEQTSQDRRLLIYFDSIFSNSFAAAEVRLFDLGERFRHKYATLRKRLLNEKLSQTKRRLVGKMFANILILLTSAGAIIWIALRVYSNNANLGDLVVFYQIFSRGQTVMSAMLGSIGQTFSISLYLENLFSYLNLNSKIGSPPNPIQFPESLKHGINFKGIKFHYPGEERTALSNFNLFIPAGKKVAIVGVNGAGKSTLIKLACRFYDPQEGCIEIDGVDIRQFDVDELRRNISVLFQFPMQYQETVAQSIKFGNLNATQDFEKIQKAAKNAGAHPFIQKLPQNYQTLLGKWFANGSELSGGEWQKIALARSYFREAQIIILDEPTSFMDSWGEADWFDRFTNLARNRTGLIITHRFTIAMRADIIHVIDKGEIIESGSHEELLKAHGFYAKSWYSQMRISNGEVVKQDKSGQERISTLLEL